jgi:hypothetical protein
LAQYTIIIIVVRSYVSGYGRPIKPTVRDVVDATAAVPSSCVARLIVGPVAAAVIGVHEDRRLAGAIDAMRF